MQGPQAAEGFLLLLTSSPALNPESASCLHLEPCLHPNLDVSLNFDFY